MTGNWQTSQQLAFDLSAGSEVVLPNRKQRVICVRRKEPDPSRMNTATDDNSLILRTARGDRLAYAALVRRHLSRLVAVARRMLGNPSLAEDAAQEAFLKLWTHAATYDPAKAGFSTWLTRITINICLDRLRKRTEDPLPEDFDMAIPADQERGLIRDQVAAKVETALQTLPERQRTALILCHYEEMSMVEAAKVMEATIDAVESLLGRARRNLKRQLESEWRALLAEDTV
jgi:RNA polymerase sigma-70 factor, ECF subfamily